MVNFAYVNTQWARTSERICPVKLETRTKASIINDYSGNRKFASGEYRKIIAFDWTSVSTGIRVCWAQFEKDSGNFNAQMNVKYRNGFPFFLLSHCSSNSIKLWNNCNSFMQSRDRCNFIKLVKNIYIG